MNRTVLVVDDNEINRLNLKLLLKDSYAVLEAGDATQAEEVLSGHRIDLLVLDLALPPEPDNPEIGMQYLTHLRKETPEIPIVVITGHDDHKLASRAMKQGALDFFGKPFRPEEVRDTIDQAILTRWQQLREQELTRQLDAHIGNEILGESKPMRRLRELITQVASAPSTVLIRGETGTGKELVARSLHRQSPRGEGPFIAINCASMEAEHLESVLFGHEKGAFAGANRRKLGWFERASGGTLLLDEIGGLPASVQGKLLRVLESGEFSRLGSEAFLNSDIRLICSTKQPLEQLVEQGKFRDDLYYRINVVNIETPPLRAHIDDVPLLANHFLQRKALLCNKQITSLDERRLNELMTYDWPGNVRELENVIERAVVLVDGDRIEHIPPLAGPRTRMASGELLDAWFARLSDAGVDADALIEMFEKRLLETALERNSGVKARAGRWLGYGERAKDKMRYLCEKHRISSGEERES
ncbi:MAG TPA: sigma-54 dependent transcriptional regulator [Mariprofundaceae bacterium]|nr:sigma-54 dependent transcriptional regulator [Mariprofundaceae bacterium]